MTDEPTATELKRRQAAKAHDEQADAAAADDAAEAATHLRRAEKAAYLRDKLAEQEQSEP